MDSQPGAVGERQVIVADADVFAGGFELGEVENDIVAVRSTVRMPLAGRAHFRLFAVVKRLDQLAVGRSRSPLSQEIKLAVRHNRLIVGGQQTCLKGTLHWQPLSVAFATLGAVVGVGGKSKKRASSVRRSPFFPLGKVRLRPP